MKLSIVNLADLARTALQLFIDGNVFTYFTLGDGYEVVIKSQSYGLLMVNADPAGKIHIRCS